MAETIVERLRGGCAYEYAGAVGAIVVDVATTNARMKDGADLLEQQAAEIERLRAEVDALKNPWRPISEAPHTTVASTIDLYNARSGIRWTDCFYDEEHGHGWVSRHRWHDSDGRRHTKFLPVYEPTHFAPLPPAPHKGE